ncbi:MAG: WecB/TagA/CpsF family glycosyltransferase [Austwickia sp.]|nr:WecB/TagA/CpsF family glycosyltransferase [Austwickia sp.]
MDRALACAVLLLAAPSLAVRAVVALLRTGRTLVSRSVVDRDGRPFQLYAFAGERGTSDLLDLIAVVAGRMRFIGPRPLTSDEARALPAESPRRNAVPGLFSAQRLRRQIGIAYDSGPGAAATGDPTEAPPPPSVLSREGLALVGRSIVASVLSGGPATLTPEHLRMLDVSIANQTMQQALDWILTQAERDDGPGAGRLVCFVNPGCLNIAVRDVGYRAVLHRADLVLPDGIGIKLASRMQGVGLLENVNGTDMFPRLCARAALADTPIYLLGARDGVAEAAGRAMSETYPGLRIVGTHHGYVWGEEDDVVDRINASGARILLVAMGVPRQEIWLERMRPRLRPAVLIGVGGLFDFYSGRIPRAPLWMREIGMEWTWRLAQEPGRMWRRYVIGNPLFLWRIWREQRAKAAPRPITSVPTHPSPSPSPSASALPDVPAPADVPVPRDAPATGSSLRAAVTSQAAASMRVATAVFGAAARRRAASRHRRDRTSTDA